MELLSNFGTAVADVFSMIATSLSLPIALLSCVPAVIGTSITIVVAIMIIKLILGR